jgi:hypothetical protein
MTSLISNEKLPLSKKRILGNRLNYLEHLIYIFLVLSAVFAH